MASGILLLRLVLGGTLAAHGSQKLFGAFGGGGLGGTSGWLRSMGFRAPGFMALLVALSEFGGGALFAAGLLTPLGALGIASAMFVAVATVHVKNGFFSGANGYEFNLLIWAGAVAVSATGAGRFSLDRAFGWDGSFAGYRWGIGVAVASVVLGLLTIAVGRGPAPAQSS